MPNATAQLLRLRIGKVCVAITGSSVAEMLERAATAIKETPFLEFRLDYLPADLLAKPAAVLGRLGQFLVDHSEVTAIATCRRTANGGRFDGSVPAELDLLARAAESGFHIVDLDLESAEAVKVAGIDKLRQAGAAVLVSFHDFAGPVDLESIYARMLPFKPDFFKIIPTAVKLSDNITLIRFLERISDESQIVGVCMGEAGIISRVLGLRAGSAFTFAAATVGEETAPGQIAARTLIEAYRIEDVDKATRVYGVAGNPVSQSLSPVMMNTAFRRETVNAVYLALHATDVKDLVQLMKEIPLHGVSVTLPHKQAILPFLANTDPLSAKIGACNTVLRAPDGTLLGFNTDVQGIVLPLEKRMPLKGAKVLVLGAGGTGRAAVFALRERGAEVHILNRTPEPAALLAKQSGARVIKREALPKANFDIIVNTTSVGMSGGPAGSPLRAEELRARLVFDAVYNPVDTPLIRLARAAGLPVVTGVEMFVQQGARQFEIWTGKPAPEDEMLKVVIHALRQRSEAAGEPPVRPDAAADERVQPQMAREAVSVPTMPEAAVSRAPIPGPALPEPPARRAPAKVKAPAAPPAKPASRKASAAPAAAKGKAKSTRGSSGLR